MAENTLKKYSHGISSFERFSCKNNYGLVWPPATSTIAAYIASMSLNHYSYSTVSGHVAAISYKCKVNGLNDNTKQFLIKSLLEGLRRTRKTHDIRSPITYEILEKLIQSLSHVCRSQYETFLFAAAFSLAHVALLRVSEVAVVNSTNQFVLTCNDIYLGENNIRLHIERSKSDQKGVGTHIDISFDDSNRFCYNHVKRYLTYRPKLTDPFFCHFDGSPLTTYQFNAVLKKALSFVGLKNAYFKSHSFRIGGATCMYKQGYSVHEIKGRGRWRSSAYKSYIRS